MKNLIIIFFLLFALSSCVDNRASNVPCLKLVEITRLCDQETSKDTIYVELWQCSPIEIRVKDGFSTLGYYTYHAGYISEWHVLATGISSFEVLNGFMP
jgi:hypothetical protein